MCASLSALLNRTATITQAGAGSETVRSGTVAFRILRCAIKVAYIFASVKAITIKFLVWENTRRKELHPRVNKQGNYRMPITALPGDCSMNFIAELTL